MSLDQSSRADLERILHKLSLSSYQNKLLPYGQVWFLTYLLVFYCIVAAIYFLWRLSNSLTWGVWFAGPLLFFEGYNIFFTIIYFFTSIKLVRPVWQPPLKGKTVDAFIPTYNEPLEVVAITAIAACQVHGVRTVYVLDDGKRGEIEVMCREIGVKYLARSDNRYAKAGNMNFGISHYDADFFLFVDCDHVPHETFIERTLGYFRDGKLAFIQTPQVFYNLDSFQHRSNSFFSNWNEQSLFYESIQPGKNRFNAAFFCGSG